MADSADSVISHTRWLQYMGGCNGRCDRADEKAGEREGWLQWIEWRDHGWTGGQVGGYAGWQAGGRASVRAGAHVWTEGQASQTESF